MVIANNHIIWGGDKLKQKDFKLIKRGDSEIDFCNTFNNHYNYNIFVYFKNEIRPVWVPSQSALKWSGNYKVDFITKKVEKQENPIAPINHVEFINGKINEL